MLVFRPLQPLHAKTISHMIAGCIERGGPAAVAAKRIEGKHIEYAFELIGNVTLCVLRCEESFWGGWAKLNPEDYEAFRNGESWMPDPEIGVHKAFKLAARNCLCLNDRGQGKKHRFDLSKVLQPGFGPEDVDLVAL